MDEQRNVIIVGIGMVVLFLFLVWLMFEIESREAEMAAEKETKCREFCSPDKYYFEKARFSTTICICKEELPK